MRFELDPEQSMLAEQVREFARQEIAPHVESESEAAQSPLPALEQLAELGLLALSVGEEEGGVGVDKVVLMRLLSELAFASGSLATLVMHTNVLVNDHLLRYGSASQKEKWLPALVSGEKYVAWAGSARLLDPEDKGPLRVEAVGDGWSLNGTVRQVLLGADAAGVMLFGTDESGRRHVFLVDADREGITREREEGVLGLRGAQPATLRCEGLHVSSADRIGTAESAQTAIEEIFGAAKTAAAALLQGISQAAFEISSAYARERTQFGKPIASFQAIQWKIAEMAMGLEAGRLLIDEAAEQWEQNAYENAASLGGGAFRFVSDAALTTGTEAIQIHGGYGYTTEFPVERLYRDILTLRARWER